MISNASLAEEKKEFPMNNEWNIHLLDLLVFVMFLIEYVFYLPQSFVVRDVKFDYVLKEKRIFMEIRLKCFLPGLERLRGERRFDLDLDRLRRGGGSGERDRLRRCRFCR